MKRGNRTSLTNVGFVNLSLNRFLRALPGVVLSLGLTSRIDDHGSFVISRSASVRLIHLFDQNFDHDYFFKLPFQGAGCPIKFRAFYFTPCPAPSCPAYEPNSTAREYSQSFRHIQYNLLLRALNW
jgi:hypothetical protein